MSILLQYPYTSPTASLTLPNPRLGNADSLESQRKIGYTMSNKVFTYRVNNMNEKLLLNFNLLRDADIANIKTWLASLGNNDIKYTDYSGNTWRVRLVSQMIPTEQSRTCLYSATLELRGQLG